MSHRLRGCVVNVRRRGHVGELSPVLFEAQLIVNRVHSALLQPG